MAKYAKTEDGYQKIEELNANKIDKDNPVATGSFSMGREPGSVIGNCSHAEGLYTTASGEYSHAEGNVTTASSYSSHAEGSCTTASGSVSHAEGSNTTASADCSHAEGLSTVASGDYSHAEGSTTIASGKYSHTEGCYTTAVNESQHVQGEFNIVDTTGTASTRGKYAHIVGNGTSSKRSNAHTLDWNGNAWFAGEVKVGGTGQDDIAAKTLATTEDIPAVDSTLTQIGQAADAKAVGDRLSTLSEEIVTTSESKVSAHNTGTDTHSDIRVLIQGLTDRLNALADSDDTTLDQLSEVVAYIKSNRSLIEAITTSKVSVADIVDNLTTNVSNKPLSAAQGVVIKTLIDALRNDKLDAAELTNAVNTALEQAKASGEFDGADGKSAYQYAVEGGYTGTEAEFAAKLAEEMPDKLPNPNALTFTGAVAGSYDGSAPLEVEIPSGGGASGDYIPIPPSAEVGQTIVVKAVDEKGKPTAWEAVTPETWNFVMADGTNVTKKVYVYANE